MTKECPFDLSKCVRPNILALPPYTSQRDDYLSYADLTLLDANENSFGPSIPVQEEATSTFENGAVTIQSALDPERLQLNRYPDAQQIKLKQLFCNLRNTTCGEQDAILKQLEPENVCLGVGSDESIDVIIRAFCTPGRDKILICPPTYGMYEVSAQVNDVTVVTEHLDADNSFALRPEAINEALSKDPLIKVVFICSPANPTGNLIPRPDIVRVLEHPTWNGIVVVDEAYVDFAPGGSLVRQVNEWPNLIVTQTLSKAFGLAGIRLGVTFSQPQISRLLNNLKGPYNMSAPTVALATAALQPAGIALMEANKKAMAEQRERLLRELPKIPGFGRFLGGYDTNFLLVQFLGAPAGQQAVPDNATTAAVARALVNTGTLVRYRGMEPGCLGSLRITVGTKEEVDNILSQIRTALEHVYSGSELTA